jgi:hypothetical protein
MMTHLRNSRLSRAGILSLMIFQNEKDALKRLPAESGRRLHPPLAALLPARLDTAFKVEL